MTNTGKTRTCLCCGRLLTEKRGGKSRWYTPDGKWHFTRTCNFAKWKVRRRVAIDGKLGRRWKWGPGAGERRAAKT